MLTTVTGADGCSGDGTRLAYLSYSDPIGENSDQNQEIFVATCPLQAPTSAVPPTIAKTFGAPGIALGANTSLTFTLGNPNVTPLTGVRFTDPLPAGMIVATPNGLTGSCGGTVSATAGSALVELTGGTLAASANCTFSVIVTGQQIGTWTNVTGSVTSIEGGSGGTASATLTVQNPLLNCHGSLISGLAQTYQGLKNAARTLGYFTVPE